MSKVLSIVFSCLFLATIIMQILAIAEPEPQRGGGHHRPNTHVPNHGNNHGHHHG